MKRLHIFMLRSFFPPLVVTFFVVLFVLLMQFVWKYIDDMVGKGLELSIIGELLLYTFASLVPMALPLAILLSSIMTFGNLGEYYELTALKTSGVSLQRIMYPLVFVTALISLLAFYFSNHILPLANLKMGALLWDVRQQKPALNIKEGVFYNGIDDFSIKIDKKREDGKTVDGVMICDHTEQMGNNRVITAEKGYLQTSSNERHLLLTLNNGYGYYEIQPYKHGENTGKPMRRMHFGEYTIRFDLSTFKLSRTSEDLFKDHYQMLNLAQLGVAVDSLHWQTAGRRKNLISEISGRYRVLRHLSGHPADTAHVSVTSTAGLENLTPPTGGPGGLSLSDRLAIVQTAVNQVRSAKLYASVIASDIRSKEDLIRRHDIEWHRKFTLSFACLLLFFIGAPLGAIIRIGGVGMPSVASVLFFLLYHILSIIGEKFARESVIATWQGMWLASAVCLPLGIFLTWKAATDSVIMDINRYSWWIRKLFGLKRS